MGNFVECTAPVSVVLFKWLYSGSCDWRGNFENITPNTSGTRTGVAFGVEEVLSNTGGGFPSGCLMLFACGDAPLHVWCQGVFCSFSSRTVTITTPVCPAGDVSAVENIFIKTEMFH